MPPEQDVVELYVAIVGLVLTGALGRGMEIKEFKLYCLKFPIFRLVSDFLKGSFFFKYHTTKTKVEDPRF